MTATSQPDLPELSTFSRQLIVEHTVEMPRVAKGTRPDLRVVELEGRKFIVKDFKHNDFLFREIVGPILIRREYGALKKLYGVEGIPRVIGRLDRYSLVMEYVDGIPLYKFPPQTATQEFFVKLRQVVDEMHARGVAHCDMRAIGNVLIGPAGEPYAVDYAACVFHGRGWNPFIHWLFHQFAHADEYAVIYIKNRFSPDLMTEEERVDVTVRSPWEQRAKHIRKFARGFVRKFFVANSSEATRIHGHTDEDGRTRTGTDNLL